MKEEITDELITDLVNYSATDKPYISQVNPMEVLFGYNCEGSPELLNWLDNNGCVSTITSKYKFRAVFPDEQTKLMFILKWM